MAQRNPERFERNVAIDRGLFEEALGYCIEKTRQNSTVFVDQVPASASKDLVYEAIDNTYWTASFWCGMLWLAYEATGEATFRQVAEGQLKLHQNRLDRKVNIDTHDLGFLYSLSCVAGYRLTGNAAARDYAVRAADHLSGRYLEKPQVIQAWGKLDDPEKKGQIIMDCLLNLPLLYWATEVTGNRKYHQMAHNHAKQAARLLVRPDDSSFHTYFLDVATGEPLIGKTHQGFADDSTWARGQAWGIYGFPLSYCYTRDWTLIETAVRLTEYFLAHLPDDAICYWDLVFTSGNEERDSSAAALAVCGILEMCKHLPLTHPAKRRFENAALVMLESLTKHYLTKNHPESNGILLHGVQHKPKKLGVDECCIWGDYYYFEAILRVLRDWKPYW